MTIIETSVKRNILTVKLDLSQEFSSTNNNSTSMKTITEKDILSAQQVANLLHVSNDTIYTLVEQKRIPYKLIGKQLRFLG
jgi:excisionase family DNA binding protein